MGVWTWLAIGFGCSAPNSGVGPAVVFDPAGASFWSTPWPSDTRTDPDGTLDVATFPDPFDLPLIGDYLDRADAMVGFGTNSPIFLALGGPVDPLAMPTPTEARDSADTALLLVDIDPDSPHRTERFPLQWEQNAYAESVYMPEHLLAVAPTYGFPLRPDTRYALIVTTAALQRQAQWAEGLDPDHPDHDPDLAAILPDLGLDPNDLAIATTFTTTDPLAELTAIATHVQRTFAPADLDAETLRRIFGHDAYTAYRTRYYSPVFTHGEPPYNDEGGAFLFEDGSPVLARFDEMRLSVCVPHGTPPPGGWPVVIYQHGTGGAYRGFCNSSSDLEVMNRLGEVGILGLGIDQPLHGSRPGAEEASDLTHFNILNPDSGVTNFRQGAVDAIYLARSLATRPYAFRTPDGAEIPTNPDKIMFMGHSQGGLTGAMAAPYLGNDVQAMVLSGAGAILAITVVERKDIIDFAEVVRNLVRLGEGEPLTPMHPIIGLIQTLVEVTDPANYAPYWFSQAGDWPGHAPVPVLVTSGTLDAATPYTTAVAMAAAGRVPLVGPPATRAEAVLLRTGSPMDLPQAENVTGFDAEPVTAGFHQWWEGTHFVLFEEPEASDVYVDFLRTAADGIPTVQ